MPAEYQLTRHVHQSILVAVITYAPDSLTG